MDTQKIQKRFDELNTARPFSARWLSDSMQLNRYSINKILSGNVKSEKDRLLLRAVLAKLGTTENEFMGKEDFTASEPMSAASKVPLFGDIPAGNPTLFDPSSTPAQWIDPPPGTSSLNLFALRVQGESMLPRFEQGDIVYFERLSIHLGVRDPENPVPPLAFERLNGRVVAVLIDGEATMKQLKLVGGAESYALLLKAFNPEFHTITIRATNEVHFQGVAVSMLRQKL